MKLRSINDRGIILPLVALMIFAIMAVIGLAVDGGRLHQARLELQKATDAAVIAAAKRFATTPVTGRNSSFRDDVRTDVQKVIEANLIATHGAISTTLNIAFDSNSDIDLGSETVRATATWNVRLMILGHFPGYQPELPVQVHSKAQVKKAMVSLMLDTSFSMICPTIGTDCSCAREAQLICNDPKILHVIAAVKDFIDLFNESRDMFEVTWFSHAALTEYRMNDGGGFNKGDLDSHIDAIAYGYHLQGSTNTCDALFNSYQATKSAAQYQHRSNIARVIFTDGAPAAGRFFFANPNGALDVNHPMSSANGFDPEFDSAIYDYDYYNWAIAWVTGAQWAGTDTSDPWAHSCSDLAKSELPYAWTQGYPPDQGYTRFWPQYPDGIHLRVACSQQSADAPSCDAALYPCLNDFGFFVPDSAQQGRVFAFGSWVPASDFRKQYYNCAIAMSDFLRRNGSIVYGVSIGDTATTVGDPYQDVANDHTRKDCLLARMTNDPEPGNPACTSLDFPAEFSKVQANRFLDYTGTNRHEIANSEGKYVFALNAAGVESAFTGDIFPRLSRKLKTANLVDYN